MTETDPPEQMILGLAHQPALGQDDYLVSASNAAAFAAVTQARSGHRLALSGPKGAGKTHLASIWGERMVAARVDARQLTEARLEQAREVPAIVVEDADRVAELPAGARRQIETLIFHLYNIAVEDQSGLLITGQAPPARWRIDTPDLASRLSAMEHVAIEPPDDDLLSAILAKLFTDRQVTVNPGVIKYMVRRMERSFAAAVEIVDQLDRLALAEGRAITTRLAAQILAPGDETPTDLQEE